MAKKTSTKDAGKKAGKRAAKAKAGAKAAAKKAPKAKAAGKVGRPRKAPAGQHPHPTPMRGIAWVAKVADPRQRALAEAVPEVTEALFGVDPLSLFARIPAADGDVRKGVANGFRELAIGAVALLGRDLGLAWSDLHARAGESGRTEVQYLYPAHRWSLVLFASRFARLIGREADEKGNFEVPVEPVAFVGRLLREEYARVLQSTVARAARYADEAAGAGTSHASAAA